MGDKFYILDGKIPVPCDDIIKWGHMFESADRVVAKSDVGNGVRVSTVFLGLDHSYGEGPPLLFETMIFGGVHAGYEERCSTWDEAEKQHQIAVAIARSAS